jgi:hypothetical protein
MNDCVREKKIEEGGFVFVFENGCFYLFLNAEEALFFCKQVQQIEGK